MATIQRARLSSGIWSSVMMPVASSGIGSPVVPPVGPTGVGSWAAKLEGVSFRRLGGGRGGRLIGCWFGRPLVWW